jgi:hypothetical protein
MYRTVGAGLMVDPSPRHTYSQPRKVILHSLKTPMKARTSCTVSTPRTVVPAGLRRSGVDRTILAHPTSHYVIPC